MRCRLFVPLVVVAWVAAGGPRSTPAQSSPGNAKSGGTLLDRLDGLGRAIFGGTADDEEKPAKPSRPKPATRRPKSDRTTPEAASPTVRRTWAPDAEAETSQPAATISPQPATGRSGPASTGQVRHFVRAEPGDEPAARTTAPATDGNSDVPALPPLHERLNGFRQSAFGPTEQPSASPAGQSSPQTSPGDSNPSSEGGTPAETGQKSTPTPVSGVIVSDRPPARGTASPASPTVTTAPTPAVTSPTTGSTGAARLGASSVLSSPWPSPTRPAGPQPPPAGPWAPGKTGSAESKTAQPGRVSRQADGQSVLFATQGPQLLAETIGPRRILVGKESTYEITVRNAGEVAAEDVVVTVELPQWADVMGADASAGATTAAKGPEPAGPFRWRLGRLDPKAKERLLLRVVPRQSRPFELAVKWTFTPAASQAQIEVQEPKLALGFEGPREVLFGKAEVYRLEVANTGNGDAENVVITISPTAPGEKPATASHQFGTVTAGQKKTIDVELTARQTGNLAIHVEARGDGGIRAERVEQIVVRRALLKAEIEAPKVQFVGTEATYRIRLTNTGDAPASHPVVTATLPPATKYVASPQSPRVSPDGGKIIWTLQDLAPGTEAVCEMTCSVTTPGNHRLDIQTAADGDLTATAAAVIQAEATANLTLAVDDPPGPVALESDATYQIHVQNRGTAGADGVEVMVYFSNGVEPTSAEGAKHKISAGQVVFEPIERLAAGQSTVLKIKAKADAPGNHIYRVEVRSEAAGARVVREGTTRFYSVGSIGPDRGLARPAARTPALSDGLRTADRRESAPSPQNASGPAPASEKRSSPAPGSTQDPLPLSPWRTNRNP